MSLYQQQLDKILRTQTFQDITKSLTIPQSLISGGPIASSQTKTQAPIRGEILPNPGFNVLNQIKNLFSSIQQPGSLSQISQNIRTQTQAQPSIFNPFPFFPTITSGITTTPTQTTQTQPEIPQSTQMQQFPMTITYIPQLQANPPGNTTQSSSKPFFEILKEGFNQIPPTVLLGIAVIGTLLLLKK